MNVMFVVDLAIIIFGLALLWRAGDYVVHYTIKIAQIYNISTFFLGFIVLAIAADIPELAIAFTSALKGASEVSVGDIIGANFTDMALVVGSTLLLAGNRVSIKKDDRNTILTMLALTAAIMALVFALGSLHRYHGVALVFVYIAAITWLWKKRDSNDVLHQEVEYVQQNATQELGIKQSTSWAEICVLFVKLFASIGLVMVSSGITVHYAVSFATQMGVSLEIIGATILGVGTSLPELALSINALRRGEYGLALGPTLGTVLGQTTLVLGMLATLSHKPVLLDGLSWAFWFMFAAFGIIAYGLVRGERMGRGTGAVLISLFAAYLGYQARLGLL